MGEGVGTAEKSAGRRRLWIVVCFLLVLRIVLLIVTWSTPIPSDAVEYVAMAGQLRAGVHFVPYWPPGLPFYLMEVESAGLGNGLVDASMLLFWLLACWGMFRLADELGFAEKVWLPLLVLGLMPDSVYLSVVPLTQLPIMALLVVALSAALKLAKRASIGEGLLLGVALGWMVLTRPSSAILLLLLPGYVVWRGRRPLAIAVPLVLSLAMVGGWLTRAHQLSGAWVINTANSRNFWYGNNQNTPLYRTWYFGSHDKDDPDIAPGYAEANALPPVASAHEFQRLADVYVVAHPGAFLLRTVNRARCFWGFDTFTALEVRLLRPRFFYPVLLLAAGLYCVSCGAAVFWLAEAGGAFWRRGEVRLIAASALAYAAPYWLSMSHPTYHFPMLPLVLLLGYAAYLGRGRVGRSYRAGSIALVVFGLIQVEWVVVMLSSARTG